MVNHRFGMSKWVLQSSAETLCSEETKFEGLPTKLVADITTSGPEWDGRICRNIILRWARIKFYYKSFFYCSTWKIGSFSSIEKSPSSSSSTTELSSSTPFYQALMIFSLLLITTRLQLAPLLRGLFIYVIFLIFLLINQEYKNKQLPWSDDETTWWYQPTCTMMRTYYNVTTSRRISRYMSAYVPSELLAPCSTKNYNQGLS